MSTGLIGREDDLGALTRAVTERPCAVVVHGEPGVGKTVTVRAAAADGLVEAGALASLRWLPYLPLRRGLGARLGEEAWRGDPEDVAGRVETAVGDDVLFLDDLHWADTATLEVAELLVGRCRLVAAVRRGDPAAPSALDRLEALGFARVELDPISHADAAELVGRLRPGLGGARVADVVERSGGNPLLIEELVRVDGRPDTLALAVGVRLRALSDDALDGMTLLSMADRPLPAARVAELPELRAAGLVRDAPDDAVEVRHALIGEAVVELADDRRRTRCHRVLGSILPHPGDRARHLLAAGDRDDAHREAMAAVEGAPTPGERAVHLRTAAACVSGPQGAELVLRAAEAANDAGEPAAALELLDSLAPGDTAGDDFAVPVVVERGRALFELGDAEGWRETVTEGSRLTRGTPAAVRFRVEEAAVAYFLDGDPARTVELAATADTESAEAGLPRASALRMLGTAQYLLGDPAWRASLEQAVVRAEEEDDQAGAFRSANNLVSAHESAGDPAVGIALADEMAATARRLGFGRWERHFLTRRLSLAMHAGDHVRVDALAAELLAQPLLPRTREEILVALAGSYGDVGRIREALAICDDLESARVRPSDRHAARARVLLADGRPLEALREREPFLAAQPVSSMVALMAPEFALAAYDAGRPAPVEDPDLPAWGMLAGVQPELDAMTALRAGDAAAAVDGFGEAASLWAPYHRRGELRCRWGRGEALRLAQATDAAQAELLALEAEAEAGGWRPLLGRTRRSLRALGVRRAAPRGPRAGLLTAREREVLALVAEGLADATIAGRLGISPRTVQSQVASARRKLGAANRREAVELLARADTRE